MSRKPTPKHIAENVMVMADMGKTSTEIGEAVGLPLTTVEDIRKGVGRWAAVQRDHWFQSYRKEMRRKHEAMAHELSGLALERIEAGLPKSSVAQAAVVFGILQDKIRLMAGESTQNIAVSVKIEDEALSKTLERLMHSLKESETTTIEA